VAGAAVLAGFATRWVVKGLAVVLFAVAFALVVVFADPIEQRYAYPVLAVAAVAGFTAVVRRGVAPVVFAVAFVLAMLPTAGAAQRLGREGDSVAYGACTAPAAAFFVDRKGTGWTEYRPLGPGESRQEPVLGQALATDVDCDRLAGQRLATSLGMVLVGVLLLLTTPRGPAADFRVRGLR